MELRSPLPLFTRGLGRGPLIALDCAAAGMYTALLVIVRLTEHQPAARGALLPAWGECLVIATTALPVAVRRLWPLPVLGVVVVMTTASIVLDTMRDPFVASACALYSVALEGRGGLRVFTASVGLLGVAGVFARPLASVPYWWMNGPGLILFGWATMGAAWVVGRAVAERRAYAAGFAEQSAQRAVAEERLHIAREVHDIVSHSMGLIVVKASIANHVARSRPQEATDALRVIESISRSALSDVRVLLGVLRSGTPGEAPVAAETAPAPGVEALPEVAERARTAGVEVDLRVIHADGLPEGVGRSVFRIVQEALTNVVKHASPTRCKVVVEAAAGEVSIEVTDAGRTGVSARMRPGGQGLVGMRERVEAYGGTFFSGTMPEGGFRVAARIPFGRVLSAAEGDR
ncbi:sensor histidine kinase [Streptomyces sp. A244]|uniref:sensor histidine kinase n=1 Tax=Streptomyces sp. A244 TaxID=2137016 RepID=UPI0021597FE2|nr:histidine kinase [Streptomyces sp. A244]